MKCIQFVIVLLYTGVKPEESVEDKITNREVGLDRNLFGTEGVFVTENINTSFAEAAACRKLIGNRSALYNLIWRFYSMEPFALAQNVLSMNENTILIFSYSPTHHKCAYSRGNEHTTCCCSNCSELMCSNRVDFYREIFHLTPSPRLSATKAISAQEYDVDNLVKIIHSIHVRENWASYIIVTSTEEELTGISSAVPPVATQLHIATSDHNIDYSLEYVFLRLQEKNLNFVVKCSSACILNIIHEAYQINIDILERSRWLMIAVEEDFENIVHKTIQIQIADVMFVKLLRCPKPHPEVILKTSRSIAVANMYKVDRSYNTSIRNVGFISSAGDLVLTDDLFLGKMYGLNNRTLTAAILESAPFVFKREVNGSVYYSGLSVDLLKELAHRLNFSYTFTEPEDKEWGRAVDGNWTGLVKLMKEKTADLVVAPIAIETSRGKVMDFTVPYYFVQSAVLLRNQDTKDQKWLTLIIPFRFEVHMCIFISVIFSTVFLFFVEEVHPINIWQSKRLTDKHRRMGTIFWYHFGALMANGRTILACWWLFTVISAAIYSGNLVAFLTDRREKPPFTTLVEMVEQDTYMWGTLGGTSFINLFQNSNRSEYRKLWVGIQSFKLEDPDVLSVDPSVHLQKVLTGEYAFISDTTTLETWQAQHCELQMLHEHFYLMMYAIGLQNNSIYTDLFSSQIMKIYESGLIDMWYKRWMPKQRCEVRRSANRVDLLAIQSLFYAAGLGVLLAVVVLIVETIYNKTCTDKFIKDHMSTYL